jgi:hypothetical protein
MAGLFVAILVVSAMTYPFRGDLTRPPSILVELQSEVGDPGLFPRYLASQVGEAYRRAHLVDVATNPSGTSLSSGNAVRVGVRELVGDEVRVTITWTFLPATCPATRPGPDCLAGASTSESALAYVWLPAGTELVSFDDAGGVHAVCASATHCLESDSDAGVHYAVLTALATASASVGAGGAANFVSNRWSFEARLAHPIAPDNGADIAAALPGVQVFNSSSPGADTSVETTLALRHFGDFYWDQGPSPVGDLWSLPLSEEPLSLVVGGVDNHVVSNDSLRVFAAGALLGIAGSALIGAVQELLNTKPREADSRRRERRSRRRAPSPVDG